MPRTESWEADGSTSASRSVCARSDISPPAWVLSVFISIAAAVTVKTATLQSWWFFFLVLVIESLLCRLNAESVRNLQGFIV